MPPTICLIKAIEHPRQIGWRNAGTVVVDSHHKEVGCVGWLLERDRHRRAGEGDGVLNEIGEQLRHTVGVGGHGAGSLGQVDREMQSASSRPWGENPRP